MCDLKEKSLGSKSLATAVYLFQMCTLYDSSSHLVSYMGIGSGYQAEGTSVQRSGTYLWE